MMPDRLAHAPRRGRPKDPAKRDALLAAALDRFLARGFAGATMEEIAAAARVAKATLYANFPDRDALLEAVIRKQSQSLFSDHFLLEARKLDLQAALETFGRKMMTFLANPRRAALESLIAAAGKEHPDLAQRFFEAGPGRSLGILSRLLAESARQGVIHIDDPCEAACDLIGLWLGMLRTQIQFGYRKAPGPKEIHRRVARGVRLFMRLYGAPSN